MNGQARPAKRVTSELGMSGGHLLVLDRAGREVKQFDLSSGLATLGSDPSCDIRIMLPSIRPHHATIVVHANQSLIRNVGSGETLLNGVSISVAALRQEDVVSLGGRELRWRYTHPAPHHARRRPDSPALQMRGARGQRGGRGRRSEGARTQAAPHHHRDSAPAAITTRQVAIVQPQRRDTSDHIESVSTSAVSVVTNVRRRGTVKSNAELDTSLNKSMEEQNKSRSPKNSHINLQNTTKATLWIESRKSSPRKSLKEISTRSSITPKKAYSAKKSTPLRMTVLKKAQSVQKMRVTKIQAPLTIDHTKQAAIMLMAGHTPRQKGRSPTQGGARRATFVVGKRSPRPRGRPPKNSLPVRASAARADYLEGNFPRKTIIESSDRSASVLEITDSDTGRSAMSESDSATPPPPGQRKSALRDPSARKGARRSESIKFDLSNLGGGRAQARARAMLRRTLGAEAVASPGGAARPPPPSPPPPARSPLGASRGGQLLRRALQAASPLDSYSLVDLVSVGSGSSRSLYGSASEASEAGSSRFATPSPAGARGPCASTPAHGPFARSDRSDRFRGDVTFDITKENVSYDEISSAVRSTKASFGSGRSRKTRSASAQVSISDNITINTTRSSTTSLNPSQISEIEMVSARGTRSKSESPVHDGASTPRNQKSPEEVGTPVLSIQSLLDSTQNTTLQQQSRKKGVSRIIIKRKTVGSRLSGPRKRGSIKSKSLSHGTRESPRSKGSMSSPNESDMTADVSQDDGDTTPKSGVKLIQEAVKNKHSTAKKPKSKRSIIDNLNESDIVKQLFNSPVKRKLSQSMIEFSRKQLLEEDTSPAKRPTRNTIALGGRTPDNSILDQSQAFTPEIFVSPLSTPSSSPNVVGLKRLFAKTTPENDLRNVRGIKKLLQTPRVRRSVRNDLTQVSGVKSVFARSPRNRLSDVGIKEVFAASPQNDLRRVSGVKSLFQSQKKTKSPKNDLGDVANVRNLFKKNSPRNDLGNVSGVKRIMRRNSPKNDLGDVRGLRTLFHLEKQREDLNNISGIEELFSESHQNSNVTDANSDNSFNLLIGKPAVRAYPKAKSFSTQSVQKPKTRKTKSFQTSFSLISNNVEDWLENELRKRMHKDDVKTPAKKQLDKSTEENASVSTSKSNRSSSIALREKTASRRKSEISRSGVKGRKTTYENTEDITAGNDIFGGNKSGVNASNTSVIKTKNKSNQSRELLKLATDTVEGNASVLTTRIRNSTLTKTSSIDAADRKKSTSEIYGAHTLPLKKRSLVDTSGNRNGERNILPIKKRAVMHSTPVKGKVNMTMNASEIGRVSPIAPLAAERRFEADATRSTETSKNSPKRKQLLAENVKLVPIADKSKEKSPAPVRPTRGRKTKQSLDANNVKKRKSSIVITKKTLRLSSKPSSKISMEEPPVVAKTMRRTRARNVTGEKVSVQENKGIDIESAKVKSKSQTNFGKYKKASTINQPSEENVPKSRKTRGQKVSPKKVETPKKITRSKTSRIGVVITKPSPLMKPSTKKQVKLNEAQESLQIKFPRARHANKALTNNQLESNPKNSLSKDHNSIEKKSKTEGGVEKRNTRNMKKEQSTASAQKSRINEKELDEEAETNIKPKRGRKTIAKANTQEEIEENNMQTRPVRNTGRQTAIEQSKPKLKKESQESINKKKNTKTTNSVPSEGTRRGRKRKITVEESPVKVKKSKKEDISKKSQGKKVEQESSEPKQKNPRGRPKKKMDTLESSLNEESVNQSKPRRGGGIVESEPSEVGKSRIAGKNRGRNKINHEKDEVKIVRGRKKQSVEVKITQTKTEIKTRKRRGEGDTLPESIEPTEKKLEKGDLKITRRQKEAEPDKPLVGRKRKADTSSAKVVQPVQPSKSRKTNVASPKDKRGRSSKIQEPQKPAARTRRR
ncbi:unnamed protein product, partial [Iphiclides podalirius]